MALMMIIAYAVGCVAFFAFFRIPVNKWTLSPAVLGGIFLFGFMLIGRGMLTNWPH